MTSSPYFGFLLTFILYYLSLKLNKKFNIPLTNPMLLTTVLVALVLVVGDISYDDYMAGAGHLTFLVAPATVALMYSLYTNLDTLKKNLFPIIIGIFVGSIVSMTVSIILAKVFGFNKELVTTIIPQSITMPIATSLSDEYKGIISITALCVCIRGNFGAAFARFILKIFKIKNPVAQGVAVGTTSHASGTAEARKIGQVQGAMSGLSIAIAGIMTVILMPFFMILVNILF